MKPKTNWNFKVLLGLTISTITQLNFLFVFFPIQQQPWHSNVCKKGLNLFDECAAKCVHLCIQEKSEHLLPEGTIK